MTPQEHFQEMLLYVVGQALSAAGYVLEDNPIHWSGGLFRFQKQQAGLTLVIEYQMLSYEDGPARFRVALARRADPQAEADSALAATRITLSRLLWDIFKVRVLPAADHWWTFADVQALSDGLVESGRLLVGYGLPWLDGSLVPASGADG